MSYTNPYDWQNGDIITEPRLQAMQDNIAFLKTPTEQLVATTVTNTTNTSFVDIASLTLTMTTNAARVFLWFTGSITAGAALTLRLDFTVDGVRVGNTTNGLQIGVAGGVTTMAFSFVYHTAVLTAASHTFRMQWNTTASTITMVADGQFGAIEQ